MKKTIALLLVVGMVLVCAACGGKKTAAPGKATEKDPVSVYVLTGPTGVGAVQLWNNSENGKTEQNYTFTAVTAPDEAVAKIANGEADIAAVSTNLAAKMYQKTNHGIQVIAVNTMGVLSVLDNSGAEITSIADLKGRKIVTTGQGANPQYIIEYLLKKSGLNPEKDVTVAYKADGQELVGVWANDPDAVIIAPSPVSTAVLLQYSTAKKVLDLTEEWQKISPDSALMMGCLVARKDFCDQNAEAVNLFLQEYEASVNAALSDAAGTGTLCEKYGIVPKAAIATKALPDCHICLVTGAQMKADLLGYLQVLFNADPTSVGKMPDDGFFYEP